MKPLMFHVNNPGFGADGPKFIFPHQTADRKITTEGMLAPWYPAAAQDFTSYGQANRSYPTGSQVFMKYAKFGLRFSALTSDTKIRVDVIRQKRKVGANTYISEGKENYSNFLPFNVKQFQQLNEFNPHHIDRSLYEVMSTRHVYLDSAKKQDVNNDTFANHILSHAPFGMGTTFADQTSVEMREATTPAEKDITIYVPMNKLIKQIWPRSKDDNLTNVMTDDNGRPQTGDQGAWDWSNQDAYENVFLLITSNSQAAAYTTPADPALKNERVHVHMWREICWQDHFI